jgi:hypothetical protein
MQILARARRPRLQALLATLLGSCAIAVAAVSGVAAQPQTITPSELGAQVSALANGIAAQWSGHELTGGPLIDPVIGPLKGDYGDAMTGQAMVVAGISEDDETLISRGIAAELADAAHPDDGGFELLGLSGAYSLNQRELANDPAWLAARGRIARFLRRHKSSISALERCYASPHCYTNLKLVSAVADISLLETGLRSGVKGSLLANRKALRARVFVLLAMAAANAGRDAYRAGTPSLTGLGILSDPSENPLAYHALSTVMLGRAILLLGPAAPTTIRDAFARTAKALVAMLAPDGADTYIGRGQAQVWTAGVTIDALAIAAELTSDPTWRGRYLTSAATALARLEDLYPTSGWGLPLVPRFAGSGDPRSYAGIDPYANTVEYNGLALWALDDAAHALAKAAPAPPEPLPSTTNGTFVDPSHTRFAAVTQGGLWFAVHALDSNLGDPRYGFGLLAAELNGPNGWESVMPAPPLTSRPVVGSVALRAKGGPLHPVGRHLRAGANGVVTIKGGWEQPGDPNLIDPGTVWTFTPASSAVTLRTAAPAGSAYELQVWYLAGARLTFAPRRLAVIEPDGTGQTYALNSRIHVLHGVRASSAYAASMRSVILLVKPPSGALVYTTSFSLAPTTGPSGPTDATGTSGATGASGATGTSGAAPRARAAPRVRPIASSGPSRQPQSNHGG